LTYTLYSWDRANLNLNKVQGGIDQ